MKLWHIPPLQSSSIMTRYLQFTSEMYDFLVTFVHPILIKVYEEVGLGEHHLFLHFRWNGILILKSCFLQLYNINYNCILSFIVCKSCKIDNPPHSWSTQIVLISLFVSMFVCLLDLAHSTERFNLQTCPSHSYN